MTGAKAEPQVQEGDILLINTGWHTGFGTREYGTLHPGLDGEAVEAFPLEKRIRLMVAFHSPSRYTSAIPVVVPFMAIQSRRVPVK